MRFRSCIAGLSVLGAFLLVPASAGAAVWAWGCVGRAGTDQLAFNRQKLLIGSGRAPRANLDSVVRSDAWLATKAATAFSAYLPETDEGLQPAMLFKHESDPALTIKLIELTSRTTGKSDTLLHGCRNEIIERSTKTYRLEMPGAEPRTVTLTCMDYQLTTRGGRICR